MRTYHRQTPMRILLIHNRYRFFSPLTWLSLLIRMFTCSKWNHIAIEVNGRVWESIGKGVISTPWQQWVDRSDRIVLPSPRPRSCGRRRWRLWRGSPTGFRFDPDRPAPDSHPVVRHGA